MNQGISVCVKGKVANLKWAWSACGLQSLRGTASTAFINILDKQGISFVMASNTVLQSQNPLQFYFVKDEALCYWQCQHFLAHEHLTITVKWTVVKWSSISDLFFSFFLSFFSLKQMGPVCSRSKIKKDLPDLSASSPKVRLCDSMVAKSIHTSVIFCIFLTRQNITTFDISRVSLLNWHAYSR